MITLDGSNLEGGGQIIRTAIALSTLKQEVVEIDNIRHGRKVPGLKAQHLHCVKALQQLCNAKTNEIKIGSEKLKFIPYEFKGSKVAIDIGTAGSITLLLQSILLPCIFSKKKVKINLIGGTDVSWSPSVDYFSQIILPQLQRYADIDFKLVKRGYYPKGGGIVEVLVKPKDEIGTVEMIHQGKLLQIKGISHASKDLEKSNVAERQARAATLALNTLNCPVRIDSEYSDTFSTGSGITLWGIFGNNEGIDFDNPIKLGVDSLGEKGKKAEQVGEECASHLIELVKGTACVDKNLADNLIPYMALNGGKIKVSEVTLHTKTNIWVCEEFVGNKFEVEGDIISVSL